MPLPDVHQFTRSVLLCALLGALVTAPIAVGAFDVFPYAAVAVTIFFFAAYAFGSAHHPHLKRVALVLISICFAVALSDVVTRPLRYYVFDARLGDRYLYSWPSLPQLQRYSAGVNYDGITHGDLATMSGRKEWREERRIKFVTDAYGFRNEPQAASVNARPLDVIVLGDSFGVAGSTSQEEILSNLLARDYGLSVYNLSMPRENPQQEYANLVVEGKRLQTRPGTCVLWLVFAGNDLDEPYYPELENPQPVSPGPLQRVINSFRVFRSRSPLHRLLLRHNSDLVVERTFDGRPVLFYAPYAQRRGRTAEDVMRHANFENLKRTLGAMENLARERQLTVSIALVPSKEEVYSWLLDGATPWSTNPQPSGFSTVLRGLSDQHGFHFLDLKPALVEASRRDFEKTGSLVWWRDDTHWNGNGQRAAAVALETFLGGTRSH